MNNTEIKGSFEGVKVLIGIPAGRPADWRTVVSLVSTIVRLNTHGIVSGLGVIRDCAIITTARDKILTEFLRKDWTHLFWIDDDMVWHPDDFLRVLALTTKVDVVGVTYPARRDPPTFFVKMPDGATECETNDLGLIQVEGLGMGFCCMTRRVVEAVTKDKPQAYDQIAKDTSYLVFRTDTWQGNFRGEDMAFFADIREQGFQVWVDPTIELGHMGPKEYRGSMQQSLRRDN